VFSVPSVVASFDSDIRFSWFLPAVAGAATDGTFNRLLTQDTLGQWDLRFLVITLAITPLRDWFNAPALIAFRGMLGLFAFFHVLMHFLHYIDVRIVQSSGKKRSSSALFR